MGITNETFIGIRSEVEAEAGVAVIVEGTASFVTLNVEAQTLGYSFNREVS
jgi:hypothetical protein